MTTKPAQTPTPESVRYQIETEDEILRALHDLSQLRDAMNEVELRKAELIRDAIPPEIQAKLDDIATEFDGRIAAVRDSIAGVESFVKTKTIAYGQSVKGSRLSASYVRGSRSWSLDHLDAYMVSHPEIKPWRKEGSPSARIIEVKRETN